LHKAPAVDHADLLIGQQLLARLPYSLVLLDRHGHLVYQNVQTQKLFSKCDSFRHENGRLICKDLSLQNKLRQYLIGTLATDDTQI
ncbi:hypothetical protein ABTN13_20320, partial [Acinetobacter baumannii]